MSLIDDKSREMLAERFVKELKDPVEITFLTARINTTPEQDEAIQFVRDLLADLHAIDSRIAYRESGIFDEPAVSLGLKTVPSLVFGANTNHKICFNGTPAGYEAQSVIEIAIMLSSGRTGLSAANEEKLRQFTGSARLQVFVTPTCPYCPAAFILAARIALASGGRITAECVEAEENPGLSAQFNVSTVPQQVVNGNPDSITRGVPQEDALVEQVLRYAQG